MLIAIEGCCHGELEDIYRAIADREKRLQRRIDLLIICGDFQAVRNAHDLESLACPPKYRRLGIFADYYTGKRRAPVPTVFIGGNHEASNYLTELYLGGWVCPNIYYLGHAGVIRVNGLRIGGLSGIYNYHSYYKGHYELPPYDRSTIRSVYHTRYYDVLKLMQIEQPLDIFVSHDWPQGIEQHGDTNGLIKRKPFFAKEISQNDLGSPINFQLLNHLQPNHWYSAHLHVKFTASVHHSPSARTEALRNYRPLTKIGTGRRPKHTNPDELTIDTSDSDCGSGGNDVKAVPPVCKPLAEPQARSVPGRARLQLPPPKNTTSADVVTLDISVSDGETPAGHSVATQPPQLTQAPTTAPGRPRLVLPPPAHTASPLPSLLEIGHSEAAPEPTTPTVLPTTVEEGTQPPSAPNTAGIAEPAEAMPMEVESVRPVNQVAPPQPIPSDLSTVRQWPRLASYTRYFGTTEFLALDKCLRGRQFLEVIEIKSPRSTTPPASPQPGRAQLTFEYDPEWLAITRALQKYMPTRREDPKSYPAPSELKKIVDEELAWVQTHLVDRATTQPPLSIPRTFEETAPAHTGPQKRTRSPSPDKRAGYSNQPPRQGPGLPGPPFFYDNPQTTRFCQMLRIPNMIQGTNYAQVQAEVAQQLAATCKRV